MKTLTSQIILILSALVLGLARVPLPTAVILWLATAGMVLAIERLWRARKK